MRCPLIRGVNSLASSPLDNNAATKPKLVGHSENKLKYDIPQNLACKDGLVYVPKH